MNADFINPFIQGVQSVFTSVANEAPALGSLFVKAAPYSAMPVTISLSIIGEITGEVVYTMKEADAFYVASLMMMGMPVTALDEMSQSAVSELGNMISGHVATIFYGKGIKIDITPPSFKLNATAADFPNMAKVSKVICIPLKFSAGQVFEVDIAIV
ncbi:MAG: chemotaxis protein CheX [Clostridiales bacterium]|jgi:chemotaxis protein CheX|nr:chemotaxis protein CheX [Clostridiales bacterium]